MLGVAGCAEGFRARKCLCDKAVRGALFALCLKIVTEHQSVGTRGDRGGCFSQPLPSLEVRDRVAAQGRRAGRQQDN